MAHYHFIAIGGVGMSAIANILLELGHEVSGSDLKDSDTVRRLTERGAAVSIGHSAENIPQTTPIVVVSSAVPGDNPELKEAHRRGLQVLHRADMLANLLENGKSVAVTGTHGKTTTTGMLATVLEKSGFDPTVLVGGEVAGFEGNAKLGSGGVVVAEADESDGSFLKLRPYIGIITNIDDDHLDHYGTLESIKQAFYEFAKEKVKKDGWVIYCADDDYATEVISGIRPNAISYGLKATASVRAADVRKEGWGTSYSLFMNENDKTSVRVHLRVPGIHNVRNSLAAAAAAGVLGVAPEKIAGGLSFFEGAARRLQKIGSVAGALVLDDYSHHPTEIRAALGTIKEQISGRVLCVYQPHRYSRTLALKDEFGTAFKECDVLLLADVYAGPGENAIEGVDSSLIAAAVREGSGIDVVCPGSWDAIVARLAQTIKSGDAVVTMGAGDVHLIGKTLLQRFVDEMVH